MTNLRKIILCSGLFLSGALASHAIPARQGVIPFRQPDGSLLQVELRGDEFSHCFISEDGLPLLQINGELRYAFTDDSGCVVTSSFPAVSLAERPAEHKEFLKSIDTRSVLETLSRQGNQMRSRRFASDTDDDAVRGLFPGTFFPAHGRQKALVILVEYADVKMTHPEAADYFTRMLNEEGFADYGATGSVVDYFRECSSGIFDPEFDVYGPVTLANNRAYYGGNDFYGRDQRPQEMVIEACTLLDDLIDFTQYDRDGDGVIDNVFIFYAGEGESNGAPSETVWPHSYNISSYPGAPYKYDGVTLNRYACSYEWDQDHPDGVGTFVHEFSHVMGLPDLYATTLVNSFTPGPWSVLDYGPYNNKGRTPPLYSIYERHALGWMDPLPINSSVDATLFPISTNQGGIIRTSRPEEYYLIENRQKEGWDAFLPGHGMLIWHIDYDAATWAANAVNNNYGHQRVDLIEADNEETTSSRAGDAFPGTAGITEFTDDSFPSMVTWEGERLGLPLTAITERADGAVTFRIADGGKPLTPPSSPEPFDSDFESIAFKWQIDEWADECLLHLYTRSKDGILIPVEGAKVVHVDIQGMLRIPGLQPETLYYVTLSKRIGWEESPESEPCEIATTRLPIDCRPVVALEGKDPWKEGFTACWLPLEDAVAYFVDVYMKKSEGPYLEVCDFTEGVKDLPAGWYSNSGSSYANDAFSGEAIPALRLSENGDYLQTPVYEDFVRSFSFWHRGNSTSEDDQVLLESFDGEEWAQLAAYPAIKEKGGKIYSTADDGIALPSDAVALRISYLKTGSKGALAIDDVILGHGERKSIMEEGRLNDIPAGNVTTFAIDGLNEKTEYYYKVTAVDRYGLRSLPSNEICISTTDGLGVKSSAASAIRISTVRGEILISGSEGEQVTIAGIDGTSVMSGTSTGEVRMSVTPGIYLVRVGKEVFKILVK